MAKQIVDLLMKIDQLTIPRSKKIKKSSNECVIDAYEYLLALKNGLCKKEYSESHLINMCFQPEKNFGSTAEAGAYCKVHLALGVYTFEKMYSDMRVNKSSISAKALKRYGALIRDFMYDFKGVVEYLVKENNPEYLFFSGGKNYHATTFEIFHNTNQLVYQSVSASGIKLDNKVAQISSVICLRQALELKFQRIVGVEFFNKRGESAKLKHDFYYGFIKDNQHYFEFPYIDFKSLT